MQVIKRDGSSDPFNFDKIKKVVDFACADGDMKHTFLNDLKINLKTNMKTKDIQKTLINLAVEKTNAQDIKWDAVASRLYIYNLVKEAGLNRGYTGFKYGNFRDLIAVLTKKKLYHASIVANYTPEQIDELGEYLKAERDFIFSYVGIKTIAERYLVRGRAKETYELPQEAYMGVAMFLALNEKPEDRMAHVKKFYDVLSLSQMTVATPTMSNARKPFNQLSSCFIGTVDDSLESIYNVNEIFSQVSKHGGGMGIYIGKVRAQNSDIRGFKNTSAGVIPWIRLINDTAVAVDQLGVRAGAVSVTLDIWHKDIQDFLQLKTNNGDERRKAHDIFPAVSIPDLFIKKLKAKEPFYLFCPHEVQKSMGWNLEDSYGDEFEVKYEQCLEKRGLPKVEVKPSDLLKAIIKSTTETGTPFLFFRDTVNRMNPNKHAGMIYSSNLCTEIMQNMSPNGELVTTVVEDVEGNNVVCQSRKAGDFVVCNLASLNLGRTHKEEDLARVVPAAIRMMDNVIDMNFYAVEEARLTNKKYRAVGLGAFDYHHMLAMNGKIWESEEHLVFADEVFENIAYYAIQASMELAKERGAYPAFPGSEWDTGVFFDRRGYTSPRWVELRALVHEYGVRNAWIIALAPNGASALYGGGTQATDPIYDKFYLDEKKNSVAPVFAPELDKYWWFYKEAHLIDQSWSVRANGIRQRHIDQAQSFNLYITPETPATELAKLYILAWELGVKTIYYTRSRSIEVEDCVSCSA